LARGANVNSNKMCLRKTPPKSNAVQENGPERSTPPSNLAWYEQHALRFEAISWGSGEIAVNSQLPGARDASRSSSTLTEPHLGAAPLAHGMPRLASLEVRPISPCGLEYSPQRRTPTLSKGWLGSVSSPEPFARGDSWKGSSRLEASFRYRKCNMVQ